MFDREFPLGHTGLQSYFLLPELVFRHSIHKVGNTEIMTFVQTCKEYVEYVQFACTKTVGNSLADTGADL